MCIFNKKEEFYNCLVKIKNDIFKSFDENFKARNKKIKIYNGHDTTKSAISADFHINMKVSNMDQSDTCRW